MNGLAVFALMAALASVFALIMGVATMATGDEVRHHAGPEWMNLRVAFQTAALVLILGATAVSYFS